MGGMAAGNGWVGGTVDGNEIPWNGTVGEITPTDVITGGAIAAGPEIPVG